MKKYSFLWENKREKECIEDWFEIFFQEDMNIHMKFKIIDFFKLLS